MTIVKKLELIDVVLNKIDVVYTASKQHESLLFTLKNGSEIRITTDRNSYNFISEVDMIELCENLGIQPGQTN